MRLLLTRPQEDAQETLRALESQGHEVWLEPLLEIRDRNEAVVDLQGVQALMVTSRNGLRAYMRLCGQRDLPVYAVGPASAATARDAGFTEVHSADGDAVKLAELVRRELDPAAGALLHPAGRDVAGGLSKRLESAGYELRRVVLYDALPARAFSAATNALLRADTLDAVLLFSPRTAETFARLVLQAGLASACESLAAFCLSPAVASAACLPWRSVHTAEAPNQEAMLEMIGQAEKQMNEQRSGKAET
ncbi:uroporphyrinogen-III synthase [Fodinicurvata halophila]|uniref:Uroporphyrinogen-III synthase n=1 Tax=Fodinicurvata halophila TaxID=1419723 RepID=A0ABV8UMV1_9PROT